MRGASDAGGMAEIAWTRVHTITDQNTCLKKSLSHTLDARHVAEQGAPIVIELLQLFSIGGTRRSSDFHRTAAIVHDLFDAHGAIMIGGSSLDGCDLARWEHRVDRDLIFIRRLR